ncbi:MAG: tetratricopeptide repeat protein [Bacteroidota bacterium]|nr:tetratricopeptide repeat protein [Bacteroidota bacterium]
MSTKKNLSLVLLMFAMLFVACSSSQQKLANEITSKEKALYSDSTMRPDVAKANEIIGLYISYVDTYPKDTASAMYLFKAGDISSKINETHQAVQLFGRMISDYPEHSNTPYALFLQGFIYENQVGDPVKARPYYEAFIKTYPDHPIAGDVSFSLEHLGKTPEELIRGFENNEQQLSGDTDTTSVSVSK